jgi:hypothetical protein
MVIHCELYRCYENKEIAGGKTVIYVPLWKRLLGMQIFYNEENQLIS